MDKIQVNYNPIRQTYTYFSGEKWIPITKTEAEIIEKLNAVIEALDYLMSELGEAAKAAKDKGAI